MEHDKLRADLEQLSRAVERMDRNAYMQMLQSVMDYERRHPGSTEPEKIAIHAAEEFALYMQGKRPLNHPLIEFRWRFQALADALAHPTMMHFLIYTICRTLVDGEGDLLQDLDDLIGAIQANQVKDGLLPFRFRCT